MVAYNGQCSRLYQYLLVLRAYKRLTLALLTGSSYAAALGQLLVSVRCNAALNA